jgi:hypothetical protein
VTSELTGFMCCFCGESVPMDEAVSITANWGEEMWQFWGAHGSCLAKLLFDTEGPLYDQFSR